MALMKIHKLQQASLCRIGHMTKEVLHENKDKKVLKKKW